MAASNSTVEAHALEGSQWKSFFTEEEERIKTLVVDSFPALGKLTALRFIEWVQHNPGGVISLPTGKTPEHFIKWVVRLLGSWESPATVAELQAVGINPAIKPDMRSLTFVQIDEFYPIRPEQHNSFYSYVSSFYIDGFGLDRAKALLIDCSKIGLQAGQTLEDIWPDFTVDLSLRFRAPTNALEKEQQRVLREIDQWCMEYENRIRALGGIGFFLGGIGPDGHIAFNCNGTDHHSTTRLCDLNYETQAAAAGDLGGIEVARKRLTITIGLGSINYKRDGVAIIIAAGEAKAKIVASSVQQRPTVDFPATALQGMPNARFYITVGAAKLLRARQLVLARRNAAPTDEDIDGALIDLSVKLNKRLVDLTQGEVEADEFCAALLPKRTEPLATLAAAARDRIIKKIERGCETLKNTKFLHTEPHHDDIMLGYMPSVVRQTREASNTHHFACLTSGFNSVTNIFMQDNLRELTTFLGSAQFAALLNETPSYFAPENHLARQRDVWQYLDGVAAESAETRAEGCSRRFIRNLTEVYKIAATRDALLAQVASLNAYFAGQYAGQKDVREVQVLKGMFREWEAECLWGYLGWEVSNIKHLRLGFYSADIFNEEPKMERDVEPVVKILEDTAPHVVGVTIDPEASGPDTHYKVLQAISAALKVYGDKSGRTDIKVWGYRNVWFRFHPSFANIYCPVSLNTFCILKDSFMNTFISQKDASFPSYELDGPFCDLAQRVQVEQYRKIKTCLGRDWFHNHPSPLLRGTRGLVFMKELSLEEFYSQSRALKQVNENR